MNSCGFAQKYRIDPSISKVRLKDGDADEFPKDLSKDTAHDLLKEYLHRMDALQYLLYSERKHSVLIVLQGLDAAGKDGVVRSVLAMNPQGCKVVGFKQPTALELGHDFLWRVHAQCPERGDIAVFNRSHYEDVLVARVHNLVPKSVWSKRYGEINHFEKLLARESNTTVLKFFLHISKDEQLKRFKKRLDDPMRNWKISESDYKERDYWPDYVKAYEEVFTQTSRADAPWFIVPSNHKWYRDLVIAEIVTEALEDLGMKRSPPLVDLKKIRKQYHQQVHDEK